MLYCNATGIKKSFSEQYAIDCGHKVDHALQGCTQGKASKMVSFVKRFGLELAERCPYKAKEQHCTSENLDGKITLKRGNIFPVMPWSFPKLLEKKKKPVIINLVVGQDFTLYGGGVDDRYSGFRPYTHCMLLVGHGREDNQEYWLFRNHYGTRWGFEGGHYKLAKLTTWGADFLGLMFNVEFNLPGDHQSSSSGFNFGRLFGKTKSFAPS